MDKLLGNQSEASSILDVCLTLKDNIMRNLSVADIAILSQVNDDKYICKSISDGSIYECYMLESVNCSPNDVVLVIFTNCDNRKNIERISKGDTEIIDDVNYEHSTNCGVIIGKISTKYKTTTKKESSGQTVVVTEPVTTVTGFIQRLKQAVYSKTLYCSGGWGQVLTDAGKKKMINKSDYNFGRRAMINAADEDTFAFDCVCLIKSILWGWVGDVSHSTGGAKYASNGVPDAGVDQMLNKCKNVSTSFANIVPGAFLWMKGHCGIYIGDGKAIECTPVWDNGVQITTVTNVTGQTGTKCRKWSKWGLLPYIKY